MCAHTRGMEWAPSPSPSVWRKRVALEGPQESGRVTSVVRLCVHLDLVRFFGQTLLLP